MAPHRPRNCWTLRAIVAALALTVWATPASAQVAGDLISVRGTMRWSSLTVDGVPFVPDRATLYGLYDIVELEIAPSGTEASYEGFAVVGWEILPRLELSKCAEPGCFEPGFTDPGDIFAFYQGFMTVPEGVPEWVLDGGPPPGYALQSVSGSIAVAGGTVASGHTTLFSMVGDPSAPPPAAHYTSVPLTVDDPTHASFTAYLGIGEVFFHDVYIQYAECAPPPIKSSGPINYLVTADAPVVLDEFTVTNPIDCSKGPLIVELEAPTDATVGAATRFVFSVKNNSAEFVSDARLHYEVKGPVRPRGWNNTPNVGCSGTGYTPETDTSTVDCTIFSFAPAETVRHVLEIGALAPGDLEVMATASRSFTGEMATESATVTAADGDGFDLQMFQPPLDLSAGALQHWLNDFPTTLLNTGPDRAENIELRFSAAGLPVTWFRLNDAFVNYRDVGGVNISEGQALSCEVESATGDFVCLLTLLEPWQELFINVAWASDFAGSVALTMEATAVGDPTPGNNSQTIPFLVASTPLADLSTTQVLLTEHPSLDSPLEFEWRIHNDGPSAVEALGFWDALGVESFDVVSAPSANFCFNGPNDVICRFFDLPPGETAVIRIRTRASSGGDYLTFAHVIAPYPEQYDPNRSNDSHTLVTDVSGRMPAISREQVVLSGSMRLPCIPGDGFFGITAEQRANERLKVRELDDGNIAGFLHTNLAYRADWGQGVVFTDGGDILQFELLRGHQRVTDRIRAGKNGFSDDLRQTENYTWIERREDGSEGMTMTWRLTFRYQQDELGRWFQVLDRTDVECKR